jgi:hypothetical protein
MRIATLALLLTAGCSSGLATATPAAGDASSGQGSEASAGGDDASGSGGDASASDSSSSDAADAACVLTVDDAGVTHGCGKGGQGPGDRDDGGGAPPPPPPDAALDASDLPFGSTCWDNAQCASDICFDYQVKGQFCTVLCDASADCPDSSLGCNGMGVCRIGN